MAFKLCVRTASMAMSLLALSLTLNSQTTSAARSSTHEVTFTMTECEGVNNCATWSFLGAQGIGTWPSGEVANLVIETTKVNPDRTFNVTIHRADPTGVAKGRRIDYRGVWRNGKISGSFTILAGDGSPDGDWYAMTGSAPVALPPTMRFCDVNCLTLNLVNGKYVAVNNTGQPPNWSETFIVESFTRESIVLRRTLTGQIHFTVIYRGQLSAEGNSI